MQIWRNDSRTLRPLYLFQITAESQSIGPTAPPVTKTSMAPTNGVNPPAQPSSSTAAPTFPVTKPTSPPVAFPVTKPSAPPVAFTVSKPTSPPVAFTVAPASIFQPFAPLSPPTAFGSAPSLPVGTWTLSPVAESLQVCVQEDERLAACLNTVPDTCNPSCGNIVEPNYGVASACESIGLICAVIQCCNVCVQETNAYGICLMDTFQCGDNQCNSSSPETNAIAVTIVFLASMVGWGMLW